MEDAQIQVLFTPLCLFFSGVRVSPTPAAQISYFHERDIHHESGKDKSECVLSIRVV